ncbi:universal stress protein [Kitasatospora sp. NPDC127111]|uniref:universal stress protein n=1 Tax=Kitasatospora sp. NPDC127111 TaxID=3345363 RepID=UPI00362AD7C3
MTAPVCAAVDGSGESLAAARWAADEAARSGAPLCLVHAWPWPQHTAPGLPGVSEVRGRAVTLLADAAAGLRASHPDLDIRTVLVDRRAPRGITAGAEGAALLVVGSAGPHGPAGLPLGSVGLSVARHASCPVVLVRAGATGARTPGEVVVGVDADDLAEPVLDFALGAARTRHAPLRVVHAWTPPGRWWELPDVERAEFAVRELRGLDRALRSRRTDVKMIKDIRRSDAAEALLETARSADLLVVGRTGRALGPVAHAVIHRAPCPVAVVPHG